MTRSPSSSVLRDVLVALGATDASSDETKGIGMTNNFGQSTRDPVAQQSMIGSNTTPAAWEEASGKLAEADMYWLTTVRPDERPHVMRVLAVWLGGSLYFCTSGRSRKARNLARNPYCSISTSTDALDLVVEGEAAMVRDDDRLHRVADAYVAKYGWRVTVRDGAFHGTEGSPTAGPPPYDVYEVTPSVAFSLGTNEESVNPTRWNL